MAKRTVNETSLQAVANAIRAKTGGSDALTFPDAFVAAIQSISGGGASGTDTQVSMGTWVTGETTTFSRTDLPFTPTGAALVMLRRSTTKGVLVTAASDSSVVPSGSNGIYTNATSAAIANVTADNFTFGAGSVTYQAPSNVKLYGTYLYLVWRSAAQSGT